MPLALLLGLVHAAVDAATVTALYRAGEAAPSAGSVFAWVVAYDLLAFGLQPALGWLQDRQLSPRIGMAVGLSLTGASVLLAAVAPGAGLALVVVLAGLGNATFHLGAGATVLGQGLERAAPVGFLVGPGAAGLALGVWFGRSPDAGPTWLAVVPVLVGAFVVARAVRRPTAVRVGTRVGVLSRGGPPGERLLPAPPGGLSVAAVAAVGLLMVSVAIRALVGGAAARGYDRTGWLVVGLPVVAVAGKALGGLVADRLGWVRTTVAALVASAPLLAFAQPHPVLLLTGLLVFQLTMPVTLVAVARVLPHHLATAFGLTCLALVVGALPGMFGWAAAAADRPALGVWILGSAVAAWLGLTRAGLGWQRRPVLERGAQVTSAGVGADVVR